MRTTWDRGNILGLCVLCALLGSCSVRGDSGYDEPFFRATTEARLVNGGYEGVVVAINPQVREDSTLIDRIKVVIRDFSRYLHQITKKRVFLREVRILIPSTWSDDASYVSAVSERFEESDIRIDHPPTERASLNPNRPYTNKPTFCGSQGLFIHLTPGYLKDEQIAAVYGGYNKVLAHEWAHYRWGVFDEYPQRGEAHFYGASSGRVEAVRCSAAIKGDSLTPDGSDCVTPPDGIPEDNCRFFDDKRSSTETSSLMYKQFLDYVTEFCDDADGVDSRVQHNAEAPNTHNRQCASRSVWQVMRSHSDFSGSSRSVALQDTQFVNVRQRPSRYVLVIDNSASMNLRILILRQASYIFIYEVLLDDEELGIVQFNTEASIRAELTEVSGARAELVGRLPTDIEGATSIGGGVSLGLDVLNRTGDLGDLGGRMIVLTDGDENSNPRIPEIINRTDSVLIHTIAIGRNVDSNLESLANRTGGRQFLHQDSSTALFDIFSQFGVESRGSDSEELVSEYFPNFSRKTVPTEIPFVRDNTLRGRITIYVGVVNQLGFGVAQQSTPPFEVYLISPDGVRTDSTFESTVSIFKILTTSQESGTWTLNIRNLASTGFNVSVLVLARTEEGQVDVPAIFPITASGLWATPTLRSCQVQTAYVTLTRGYNPVVDPVVNATIETPNGIEKIQLFDDGIGEDITEGDGVYSGFFPALNGVGRYSAQFSIRGDSRIVMGARVGTGAAVDPDLGNAEWDVEYQPGGDVQRTITGGSFRCQDEQLCARENHPDGNIYGPYRVTNLRVRNVDNGTFDLVFAAPGADLMSGTASGYDIRWSTDFSEFQKVFDAGLPLGTAQNERRPFILTGNPGEPSVARSEEVFTIRLPANERTITYFFALTATDGTFTSPPSNMASVMAVGSEIPPLAPSVGPNVPAVATEEPEDHGDSLWAIVGAALFLLLLLLLILLLLLLLVRVRQKEKKADANGRGFVEEEHINGSPITVNGEMVLSTSNGHRPTYAEDDTRGNGIISDSGHSHAEQRGRGDMNSDPYRDADNAGMGGRHSDHLGEALAAGQHRNGLDRSRDADQFSYPGGGFDHSAHSNIHSRPQHDSVRGAERMYNFLPGNPHAVREHLRDAELRHGEGGDYAFLPPDRSQADTLRHATFVQDPSDYQFLPAESQEYGDLRMAHIEHA